MFSSSFSTSFQEPVLAAFKFNVHFRSKYFFSLTEHYVFPDDQPTHDQNEVKTIEEECLVRVAYPELVESFMRDKAQAEENKANSKNRIIIEVFHHVFFENDSVGHPRQASHIASSS